MDEGGFDDIQALLSTRVFGRTFEYLPRIGSPNDVAKRLAVEGAGEGTVIVADEQSAGRGRLGRRWVAPPGTCLLGSILFRPDLLPSQAPRLTMLTALAAADAIAAVAGLHVQLKWPNDLIVVSAGDGSARAGWKKLAGILTETGIQGRRLGFAVVGFGINVNVPPQALPELDAQATSVLAETGRHTDRATLLAKLLAEIERRYQALQAGLSPHREWAARLATLGQRVWAACGEETLSGMAEAVDEDGALLLRAADGTCHRLLVGDVTLKHT